MNTLIVVIISYTIWLLMDITELNKLIKNK